jgi:hypothetical protein
VEYETPAILATFEIQEVIEAAVTATGGYNHELPTDI